MGSARVVMAIIGEKTIYIQRLAPRAVHFEDYYLGSGNTLGVSINCRIWYSLELPLAHFIAIQR